MRNFILISKSNQIIIPSFLLLIKEYINMIHPVKDTKLII